MRSLSPAKFVPVALIWVLALGLVVPSMFFYHPTTEVFISSVGMIFILMLLASWVGLRFNPKKPIGYFLLLLVTVISGFMAVQGFDAVYVLYFAPAGGRWDAILEISIVAAFLFLFALINLLFWPKREIDAQADSGEKPQNP